MIFCSGVKLQLLFRRQLSEHQIRSTFCFRSLCLALSNPIVYITVKMNIPFTKCTLFADQVHPFR